MSAVARAVRIVSDEAMKFSTTTLTADLDDIRSAFIARLGSSDEGEGTHYTHRAAPTTRNLASYVHAYVEDTVFGAVDVQRIHRFDFIYKPRYTVVATPSRGHSVTRFQVQANGRIVSEHATKSEASAASRKLLKENPHVFDADILAVKSYANLPAGVAARLSREVVSAKLTINVTLADPRAKPAAPTHRGWLFYGVAPH